MIQEKKFQDLNQKKIYLLLGKEDYLKREFVNRLKNKFLQNDAAGLNFSVFDSQDRIRDVVDSANTLPFISQNRLILVKEIEKFQEPDKELFISYLKNPSKTTILLIETNQNLKDAFLEEIKNFAEVLEFNKPYKSEFKVWLLKFIASYHKRISPDAIELLMEVLDDDLELASRELEKLVTFTARKNIITKQDVEEIIFKSMKETAFDFVEEICKKKIDSAIKIALNAFKGRRKLPELSGLLAWQLKRLWKVKVQLNKGASSHEISRTFNIPDYIAKKLIDQSDAFTIIELKRMLKALLKIDRLLKSGSLNPKDFLEVLVAELFTARS